MEPPSSCNTPLLEQSLSWDKKMINSKISATVISILKNIHTCLCETTPKLSEFSIEPINTKITQAKTVILNERVKIFAKQIYVLVKFEIQNNKQREFLKNSLKIVSQIQKDPLIEHNFIEAITLLETPLLVDQLDQYDLSIVDEMNKKFLSQFSS